MSVSETTRTLAAKWFAEFEPIIRQALRARTVGRADIDDLSQEVYLRMLRIPKVELIANPQAYLYRVAVNVAEEWRQRASQALEHSSEPLPNLVAAEVAEVTADGQQVTDLLGNFTAGLFGFSPTPVRDAINEAMDHGHALGGAANLYEARVAREFTARFPSVDLVRFTMTGTEANAYAINTARAVTGKNKILIYDGAYHGPGCVRSMQGKPHA